MTAPLPTTHPAPRDAGPDLLVLQRWEGFCGWLLDHTRRWPKHARATLTVRVESHALDLVEMLVEARYERGPRARLLREANLRLERMRFLFRLARGASVMPARGFEKAMRDLDETGRMLHGWRVAIGERPPSPRRGGAGSGAAAAVPAGPGEADRAAGA